MQAPSMLQIPLPLQVIAGSQNTLNRRNDSYYQSHFISVKQWALSSSATLKIPILIGTELWFKKIESLCNITTYMFFESKLNSTQKTHKIHDVWTARLAQNQLKWYIDLLEQETP